MPESNLNEFAPRPVAPEAETPIPGGRLLPTVGLMIATALQAADATIANVALPRLTADLGGSMELGAWVLTGYLCAAAAAAPLTGWMRRRFGAPRLFTAAAGAFVLASLCSAAAPSLAAVILFRVVQGAGGGVIHPLAQGLLLDLHPKERHGRILAIWGAAAMAGPILGPLIGGIITDLSSWRIAFAASLPPGLLAIWLVRRFPARAERGGAAGFDIAGTVLMVIGIGALQLCLERGAGRSWLHSPELIAEAAIALSAVGLLAVLGARAQVSVVRPTVFRDINFAAAGFFNLVLSGLLFAAIVFVPLLAEGPLGYAATTAGSLIVPRALLMTVIILGVGRVIGRVDYWVLLVGGWCLMAAGLAILATPHLGSEAFALVVGSTVQAAGAGLLFTPLNTLAYATLAPELRTDAAGIYSLLRQLGCASGVALMTAVLQLRIGVRVTAAGNPAGPARALAELAAYRDCFRMMAVACLAVIPAVLLIRPPKRAARATA